MRYPHRPFCWLLLSLSFGIIIGYFLPWGLFEWLVITSGLVSFALFSRKSWPIYAATCALGAALIHLAHPPAIDAFYDWRQLLRQCFYQYLNADEAGTMSAIVLGDRGSIPKEINMIFRHTGTGHILVIAGLHMAMMTTMVVFILKLIRLPRHWQGILSIGCILTYALLCGASIPVMRAALMASGLLASVVFEVETDAFNSLSMAAMLILLSDAHHLFDTSFQLSFAAVFSIIFLYGPIEKFLNFLPKFLSSAIAVSTAAWIGIMPLQWWHFGSFTPVALIANLFIVPLLDLTVALGLILVLTALVLPPMAWAVAGCLKIVFNLMVVIAFWFTQIPYGYIQIFTPAFHPWMGEGA